MLDRPRGVLIGEPFVPIRRAAAALAIAIAIAPPGQSAQAQTPKLDAYVQRAMLAGESQVDVIVTYPTDTAAQLSKKKLENYGVKVRRDAPSVRGLALKASRDIVTELSQDSEVLAVSYDAPVRVSTEPVWIDASGARAARSRYRVSGAGATVAVIDSGLAPSADLPTQRIRAFVDFVGGKSAPYDDNGHGTHVAGIIAGDGSQSGGRYAGMAPKAGIVALKVLDKKGAGRTSDVIAALEWVLANHAAYDIRVVNLSLGHPVYEPAATDPLVRMVEAVAARGLVVVVAAGNLGRLPSTGQTVYSSVLSPGNAPSALTVGALDTNGTLARSDDAVTGYSGRGPTRFDGFLKPDIVAPGHAIVSLAAPGNYLLSTYPHLAVGDAYMRLNGTSMAAPVVAGAASLMLGANTSLPADAAKALLQYTAQRLAGTEAVAQGAGAVNAAGAVRLARLINTRAAAGTVWVEANRAPTRADLLFGETAAWGRATLWGRELHTGRMPFIHAVQWMDTTVWGQRDNIVWSQDDNIVWSQNRPQEDGLVWGTTDDNVVWGQSDDSIAWGQSGDVVWGQDDNIVWSQDDNVVWAQRADNIVWGQDDNIVWSQWNDNVVWSTAVLTVEVR